METCVEQSPYIRYGIELLPGELKIDLSAPMGIVVHGVNEKTGESKTYFLRVTAAGKLVLQ